MCYSFAPGANPELIMKMVNASTPAPPQPTKPPTRLKHRRARDEDGQFKPDDPVTPANEAWEPTPEAPAASDADESISEAGKT